jgi:uncharacterized protein YjbI with pentapeptide repeats
MTPPQRAPVRPRVLSPESGEILLLEDEVRRLLDEGPHGVVAVLGPIGAGKTFAVNHLRAVLGDEPRLALLDEPAEPDVWMSYTALSAAKLGGLVVYTAEKARLMFHAATYRLAPWEPDDWIEYLLAIHRPRCASVMARVRPDDRLLLGDLPERWAAILDRLAEDDALSDARAALHRYLGEFLSDTDLLERARSACLNALVTPQVDLAQALEKPARPGFGKALVRALRCPAAQGLLAAERIAADLHGDGACDYLAHRLPRDLVKTAAALAAGDLQALEHLHGLLDGPSWSHAMSASLLHALDVGWAPEPGDVPCLAGAYLDGARWPRAQLVNANLIGTDLSGADLHDADLAGARLDRADFTGANLRSAVLAKALAANAVFDRACLRRAWLNKLSAPGAHLEHADLSQVFAEAADFKEATLAHADLSGAYLQGALFAGADLTAAVFTGAVLRGVDFRQAKIEGADFAGADLMHANLGGLTLREARWDGACFHGALLEKADLEYLTLPGADFSDADLSGALLTGSSLLDANLRGACLCGAGLADVDWERADLRHAQLRGAAFHLGSSRSGLVGSPIACEGSRTGFYTDEYDEQSYKAPEDIRKANLCCADLRGADLEGVDFYLVDLRGAVYDAAQAEHLRRCGAILEAHV